jgi:hypothetical protein
MMNVSPEELRRLQILNDYIAQTFEATQRLHPALQHRSPWQAGMVPGMLSHTPWAAVGTFGTMPYVPMAARTPFVPSPMTPVQAAAYTAAIAASTPYGIPHVASPFTNGIFHSGYGPMVPGMHPLTEASLAATGMIPPYAAMARMPYAVGPYTPYGTGLQHTAASPYAAYGAYGAGLQHTAASPYAAYGAYGAGLQHSAASPYSAYAPYSAYGAGLQHSAASPYAAYAPYSAYGAGLQHSAASPYASPYAAYAPIASAAAMGAYSPYMTGLQHTAIDPITASTYGAMAGIDPYTSMASGYAGLSAIAEASRMEAYRRAMFGMPGWGY